MYVGHNQGGLDPLDPRLVRGIPEIRFILASLDSQLPHDQQMLIGQLIE
jgi:hypothetical protein